ncbi:MAG TPA: hypothetical protein VGQ03_07575 [Nitrososphaera sp.]|nr:hypothetical protein [Nitrososphaera sp.]
MSALTDKLVIFWHKYENLNLKIAFVLISLQLIHLYWLTVDVVIKRLMQDESAGLSQTGLLFLFFIVIDYIEIPGLVAGLTYYGLSLYKDVRKRSKNALFFTLLAVQVFHIFWITDEVVFETFFGPSTAVQLPFLAAWAAILVDYLELPVIADLFYRTIVKGERRKAS